MHKSSMERMKWFKETHLTNNRKYKILDVGSYDVNGSYKELFSNEQFAYSGLDMEEGPNVDIVPKHAYIWDEIDEDTYDATISGQALEHIEFFWITVSEMIRVTKRDGLICIIAPNGFGEHRYPVDCWRFFTDGMVAIARYYDLEIINAHTNMAPKKDLDIWFSDKESDSMLIARKPYSGAAKKKDLRDYRCIPCNHTEISGGMKSYERQLNNKHDEAKSISNVDYNQGRPSKLSKIKELMRKVKRALK